MRPLRICLVMFGAPFDTVSARLQGRIKLFGLISNTFYLLIDEMPAIQISGEKVQVVDLKMSIPAKESIRPSWMSPVIRFLKYIAIQVRMSRELFKISKDVEIVIFYTGLPFVLPLMLVAKFLGKKVLVMTGGSEPRSFAAENSRASISLYAHQMLEKIWCHVADNIGVETESTISFMGFDNIRNKISIYGAMIYIDTDSFRITRDLRERENFIGYIGNLLHGKGVMNFVVAAELILRQHGNIEFLIGGDGPLFSRIRNNLESNGLRHKVELAGWIQHDEIPDYLSKLKLLVLPSYSEGLPGIILEAMACGTLVLATPVGGIPDVIKDGETGFIMEDNSSECIAENIERALNYPDLDKIVKNARELVMREFSFEATVKRYKKFLENV